MAKLSTFKNSLIITTTLAAAALVGYGRRAYAAPAGRGVCTTNFYLKAFSPTTMDKSYVNFTGTYCDLAVATTDTSTVTNGDANIDYPGTAVTVTGDGAITFTDTYNSTFHGSKTGLDVTLLAPTSGPAYNGVGVYNYVHSSYPTYITDSYGPKGSLIGAPYGYSTSANYGTSTSYLALDLYQYVRGGNTPVTGSLTINADGDFTGDTDFGIRVTNQYAAGAINITLSGDVEGGDTGINILQDGAGVVLTTAEGSTVVGDSNNGISVTQFNNYNEDVVLNISGDVTGKNSGIYAVLSAEYALNNPDLRITVGGDSTVTGQTGDGKGSGIWAVNPLDGHTYVTVYGTVSGYRGVYALNGTTGGDCGVAPSSIGGDGGLISISSVSHSDCGKGLTIATGYDSNITAAHWNGIFAINKGAGSLTIYAGGVVSGGATVVPASIGYGSGPIEITSVPAHTRADGIYAYNAAGNSSGPATNMIITTGDGAVITGEQGYDGVYAKNMKTTGILQITNGSGATITSALGTGVFVANNKGTYGTLGNAIGATISGATGIHAEGNAFKIGGINNWGTIEGTGGTAIELKGLTNLTPINIYGGHVIGDVIDNAPLNGRSPVTIRGDFTSEANFDVSGFNVLADVTFTMGKDTIVKSVSAVNIAGTVVVPFDPTINGSVNIATKGLLDAEDDLAITGNLLNNGTITLAAGAEVSAATMTTATAGTLSFVVNSKTAADHGLLTITNGPADLTGQTITVDVSNAFGLTGGDTILIVDGTTALLGDSWTTPVAVEDNSPLYKFKLVDGADITDNSDLFLMVLAIGADNTPNDDNVEDVLDDLGDSDDPQIQDLHDNLDNASSGDEYHRILESTQPAADGGAVVSTLTFIDNALNLTGNHLNESALAGDGETGVSAGIAPSMNGQHVWAEASGQMAHQGFRDHVAGFEATLAAMTMGMDTENLLNDGILGITFSYGKTLVNSNNANHTDTAIDNYQLTLYANRDLGNDYYVNGMLAGALNKNTTLRHNVGFSSLNAHGEFDSHQFAARAEGGRVYKIDNLTFTPMALLNAVYYSADPYTETGALGYDLTVTSRDLSLVEVGFGGKVAWNFWSPYGERVMPELHASYRRDLVGDKIETSSTFAGGGSAFAGSGPDPAVDKLNLGAQLKYLSVGSVELTASYDFDIKKDYAAHTALMRLGYKF
ncbi:MAG: autotransporter outer membrane beta-barrel domain-containing protein [Alphaproteobacteria bacterium]|nr:autotransporter outer membrane beta-barrel domain-containing protein [Alphaproteobacteria bacterium]